MKFKMKILVLFMISLSISGCTESTTNTDENTTHSVAFRITSTTNSNLTGVAISYDITDGTRVRDLFVGCNVMPWQSSTYSNIESGMGVGISILINNGPSYGGNGDITLFIIVDDKVWKSTTVTMTTHATLSLGGTIP